MITIFHHRNSCGIQFEYEVVITGGGGANETDASATVSIYNIEGWVKDLPKMTFARFYHGCGHYLNEDKQQVLQLCITIYV